MLDRARQTTRDVVDLVEAARRRRTGDLVLELDLTEPLIDAVPHDPLSAVLARRRTSLRAVLEGLRRAGRDRRVRAVVMKVGGSRSSLSLSRAQELRDAVGELRRRGTLTVAWAETFGELDRGSAPYYLASGCDQVWLQPSGDLCLTGVAVQVPFLRDALDKAGVTAQVAQRHEYKSAANLVTEQAFTPAHREATERLVASLTDQIVAGVAAGRRLDAARVRDLVDHAPLFATEALDAGLVDRLGYRDEVYAAVREQVGAEAVLCYVDRYARSTARSRPRRGARPPRIAVVDVTGTIHLGRSGRQPLSGVTAGAATVCAALRAAAADRDVAAVVLRVDSRGGSYVASDAIWRQVAVTREVGTPVVASMGDVAASGGYFVAVGADAIVAEPATLTGSIGVLAGKGVVTGLAERLGIGHESVAGARRGLMFSPLQPFSDDEWARLNDWLDRVYRDFTAKVAAGRGLAPDRVEDVARGRVWSGADAAGRGLVDELGGLATAAEVARVRAGLAPDPAPELVTYPRVPLVARLRRPRSSEDPAAASAAAGWDGWGDLAALAARLGLPPEGPLTLPAGRLPV